MQSPCSLTHEAPWICCPIQHLSHLSECSRLPSVAGGILRGVGIRKGNSGPGCLLRSASCYYCGTCVIALGWPNMFPVSWYPTSSPHGHPEVLRLHHWLSPLLLLAALQGLLALGCSHLLGSTEAMRIASMSFRSLLHASRGGSGGAISWGPLIAHTYLSISSICTTTPIRVWALMSVV